MIGYLTGNPGDQKALRRFWLNRAGPCTEAQHTAGYCG